MYREGGPVGLPKEAWSPESPGPCPTKFPHTQATYPSRRPQKEDKSQASIYPMPELRGMRIGYVESESVLDLYRLPCHLLPARQAAVIICRKPEEHGSCIKTFVGSYHVL